MKGKLEFATHVTEVQFIIFDLIKRNKDSFIFISFKTKTILSSAGRTQQIKYNKAGK